MDRRKLFATAAAGLALPLVANTARGALVNKFAEELKNGEYNWFPERSMSGPVLLIVSIPDQKLYVYRNGIRVAASTCSTGKPGHKTPTGVFKILQKDKFHRSSTYNNAPMPNMNRLTWSGIALHAGQLPGYPASHGCVRLPLGFSEMLFGITRKGMTVVIADNASQPAAVVHPKLILGDYAREKFAAVDHSVSKSQHSDDREFQYAQSSLIVSGKDRKATLYENGYKIVESPIEVSEPKRPLRNAVYKLNRTISSSAEMHWSGMQYGKGDREALESDLPRIKTPQPFAEEVHRRAHRGLNLVTTADSHNSKNRTPQGFVIIDGLY
jgi:L,D-transpeptidase catalytic domain